MNQVEINKLFRTITQDDLVIFSSIITNNENICFGRFPILTLCYLYNAKRIIKKYKQELLKVTNYNIVDEPFEAYQKFKKVACRCLRLYLIDAIVSPIEMLAILNKDSEVKKLYKELDKNSEKTKLVENNLKSIYLIHKQKFQIDDNKIKIGRNFLSSYQLSMHKLSIKICVPFLLLISFIFIITNFTVGLGTSVKPFEISNQTQFYMALNNSGNFILKNDIYIDSINQDINFHGNIDGNNKKLIINNSSNFLIKRNYGKISNLNINFSNIEKDIFNTQSLFIDNNIGEISNVNIFCESLNLNYKGTDKNIYVSAFVNENDGIISNCKLNLKANLISNTSKKCFFSGFVNKNKNEVTNCLVDNNSSLNSTDVDLTAIATNNEIEGKILNCKNYANIFQTNNKDNISPNIAGISLINYGKIKNSYNLSSLKIISNNDVQDAGGVICVGGICAINYSEVEKCLNKGDLFVESKKNISYLGGITAHSSYYYYSNEIRLMASIKNCGVEGNISVESFDEKGFVFAGGISGYLYGEVLNCYSLASFSKGYTKDKYFMGYCVGASQLDLLFLQYFIRIDANNNCVLYKENINYHIGSLINGSIIYTDEEVVKLLNNQVLILDSNQALTLETEELIKQQEVYWHE